MSEFGPDEEALAEIESDRKRVRAVVKTLPSSKSTAEIAELAETDEETAREECERLVRRLVARRIGDDRYDVRLWMVYYNLLLRKIGLRS